MTEDEIRNMPAGKEMDKLISTKVMNYCSHTYPHKYSTRIKAAWRVVKRFAHNSRNKTSKEMGFAHFNIFAYPNGMWLCNLGVNNKATVNAYAETAPLAICRAALLAVIGDEK